MTLQAFVFGAAAGLIVWIALTWYARNELPPFREPEPTDDEMDDISAHIVAVEDHLQRRVDVLNRRHRRDVGAVAALTGCAVAFFTTSQDIMDRREQDRLEFQHQACLISSEQRAQQRTRDGRQVQVLELELRQRRANDGIRAEEVPGFADAPAYIREMVVFLAETTQAEAQADIAALQAQIDEAKRAQAQYIVNFPLPECTPPGQDVENEEGDQP